MQMEINVIKPKIVNVMERFAAIIRFLEKQKFQIDPVLKPCINSKHHRLKKLVIRIDSALYFYTTALNIYLTTLANPMTQLTQVTFVLLSEIVSKIQVLLFDWWFVSFPPIASPPMNCDC